VRSIGWLGAIPSQLFFAAELLRCFFAAFPEKILQDCRAFVLQNA